MACFDTTFCIDLLREKRSRKKGPAEAYLKFLESSDETSYITLFTAGELYAGLTKALDLEEEQTQLEIFLNSVNILPFYLSTAQLFGGIYGVLRAGGIEIGAMDALI